MNGTDVARILEQVSATSSRNDKEIILGTHAPDPLFRKVLIYAYDPNKVYGIKKFPPELFNLKPGSDTLTEKSPVWALLLGMADGAIAGKKAVKLLGDWIEKLDEDSGKIVLAIIQKDLRVGVAASTINKVIPGLVPTFDCMLAHKFSAKRVKVWPVRCDIKEDGFRALVFVDIRPDSPSTCGFFSRSGKPYPQMAHLGLPVIEAVRGLRDAWVNGVVPSSENNDAVLADYRVVIECEAVSNNFKETSSELRRKDNQADQVVLRVFDILPGSLFDGEDASDPRLAGYEDRRKLVAELIKRVPEGALIEQMPSYLCSNEREVHAVYEALREMGKEGVIVKPMDGIYERKRSYGWMKIKAEETIDIEITGAYEGEGKYAGMLGGLLGDHKGVEVRVGGGFSDDQRREFWAMYLADLAAKDSWGGPVENQILGVMMEVNFHEITPDGSLRHPRFKKLRRDKRVSDGSGVEIDEAA